MKRHLVSFVFILTLALTVSPALASPPTTTTQEVVITNQPLQIEGRIVNCGDLGAPYAFHIIENAVVMVRETTFFDRHGLPTRIQLHIKYSGTLTNSVTGYTVSDAPDPINIVVNFREQTTTVTGLNWSINIPGEGHVVLNAGRVVFDETTGDVLFDAGPRTIVPGDPGVSVLCRVLA